MIKIIIVGADVGDALQRFLRHAHTLQRLELADLSELDPEQFLRVCRRLCFLDFDLPSVVHPGRTMSSVLSCAETLGPVRHAVAVARPLAKHSGVLCRSQITGARNKQHTFHRVI